MAETIQTPEQLPATRSTGRWSKRAGSLTAVRRSISARDAASRSRNTKPILGRRIMLSLSIKKRGVIEAKPKEWGQKITTVGEPSDDFAEEIIENLEADLIAFARCSPAGSCL